MIAYFFEHLTVAMIITGLIGFFGNMYEPGPVPKSMFIAAVVYVLVWIAVVSLHKFIQTRKAQRHKRKFQMFYVG